MVCPNKVGRYPKAKINSVAKKEQIIHVYIYICSNNIVNIINRLLIILYVMHSSSIEFKLIIQDLKVNFGYWYNKLPKISFISLLS